MNIGQVAGAAGVTAKRIRYYEEIGLVANAIRSSAGYRIYSENDVHTLRFVQRARRLGFSLGQIKDLLALWHDRNRNSGAVKKIALSHINELQTKIEELQSMVSTLAHLAERCEGDLRPDCPILDDLEGDGA